MAFDLKKLLEKGVRTVSLASDRVNPLDRDFRSKPFVGGYVGEVAKRPERLREDATKVKNFLTEMPKQSAQAASVIPEFGWRAAKGIGRQIAGDKNGLIDEIATKPYYAEKALGGKFGGDFSKENLKKKGIVGAVVEDPFNRRVVGKATELPTYFYGGAKGLGNVKGNLGQRVLNRSTAVIPEALAQTGIDTFIEGDTKNLPRNLAQNVGTMVAFSNVAGGLGDVARKNGGKLPVGMSVEDVNKNQQQKALYEFAQSTGKSVDDLKKASESKINKLINDEVKYLKESGGKGVVQGGVKKAEDGTVIGRFGRQSNNPQWYRDLYAEKGRKPSVSDLKELAVKRLREGDAELPANDEFIKAENLLNLSKKTQESLDIPAKSVRKADVPVKGGITNGGKPPIEPPVAKMPTPPEPRPRGFIESAKQSEFVSPQAKAKLEGDLVRRQNEELQNTVAVKLSKMDQVKAHEFALKNNSDEGTTAAINLAQQYRKSGNYDLEASLINEKARRLTEAGREIQAASLVDKMSPEGVVASAVQNIQKYNQTAKKPIPELTGKLAKQFSEQAQTIEKMAEGREKNLAMFKLKEDLLNLVPSSVADKAITVWKAGLLTSLRTHERNILGNSIMLGSETAKDIPAVLADKAMSLATGKRTLTAQTRGLGEAMSKKTRGEISDLVVHGVNLADDISQFDIQHHITWENTPIQQGLKKVTDAVFRPLGAEDRAFYNAAYARSLWDQAGAEAINAGKKGDVAYMRKLVNKPTEDMLVTATKDANYTTFHDKNMLSGAASGIKRALKTEKFGKGASEAGKILGDVVMPFTGVPSSIVGKTIAYSPIGLTKGAIDFGRVVAKSEVPGLQRKAAQEIGRGVVGTGLFGLGAYLMNKGVMTGQPKDKKEADLWAAQGKQANSVLVNGKWRSINSVGPQTLVVLAGAKSNEMLNKDGASLAEYGASLGKDQLSQTFLSGVQGPLNAITDPARYGKSYVGNQSASIVPNIVKDTAKAFDDKQRENNTIGDYFQNSIPGWRNKNVVKRDVLGQEMKQEPTGAAAYVDLFNSKTPINNEITNELGRLYDANQDATPAALGKTAMKSLGTEELTPQQLNDLEGKSGGYLKPALTQLIKSEAYKASTDEQKKSAIDAVVKNAKEAAKLDTAEGGVANINNLTAKANMTLEKDLFDKSGKAYLEKNGMVYRRGLDGNVTVQTKDKFDYQIGTAKLAQFKAKKDVNGWMKTANEQLDRIDKQLQDPTIDPLEAIQLQNDAESLMTNMEKYADYGGFDKSGSKSAKQTKLLSLMKNNVAQDTTLSTYKSLDSLLKSTKGSGKRKVALKQVQVRKG